MIIECKKRAEGYKPVKGNEKEIINHLLDHYGECYVAKDEEVVSFMSQIKHFLLMMKLLSLNVRKMGRYTLQRINITLRIMMQYHLMQAIRIC